MNTASSRSHCVYIFTIQLDSANDRSLKSGKLILVDLAGSEKVEKLELKQRPSTNLYQLLEMLSMLLLMVAQEKQITSLIVIQSLLGFSKIPLVGNVEQHCCVVARLAL